MKGVSTVVATVLVLMITVALAATSYIFFTNTFSNTTAVAAKNVNQSITQTQSSFAIDSVAGGVVYIRNTGLAPIALDTLKILVTVDGKVINATGTGTVSPGAVGSINLNSFVDYSTAKLVRVTSGTASASATFEASQNYPNLVAYWKLDEVSGSTAVDTSGNSYTAAVVGTPIWNSSGISGGALTFSAGNYLSLSKPMFTTSAETSGFTIEAWIRTTSSMSGSCCLSHDVFSKAGGGKYILFPIAYDTTINGYLLDGTNSVYPNYNVGNLNNGNWHHIVLVRSGTTAYLYYDGNLVTQATNAALGDVSNSGTAFIGYGILGTMDQIRIWNTSLSSSQIAAHYLDKN